MALHARPRIGRGQSIEVSQLEVLALMNQFLTVGWSYTHVLRRRTGMPYPFTIVEGANGYLGVNALTEVHWRALCAFIGHEELLDDPRFQLRHERAANGAAVHAVLEAWAKDKPVEETFLAAESWRLPFGMVPPLSTIPELAQHKHRSFFADVEHPDAGRLTYPRPPWALRTPPVRSAPRLGADTAEIVRALDIAERAERVPSQSSPPGAAPVQAAHEELGDAKRRSSGDRDSAGSAARSGPLTDVRIVDLTMWWAGPLTTAWFAQMGADVIKVESIQRPDGWRMVVPGPAPERSHVYNGINLNKRGITLDLGQPEGRELLLRLVADADVLVENYSPRVLGNFGLTDEVLFERNARLLVLSMPAFGADGPWGDFVGFAPNIEQLSGLPNFVGYEGGPPALGGTALADPVAGLGGTFTLLAALREREQTGRGKHIDLSQLEVVTSFLGAGILEARATGREASRHGSADPTAAPHGVYPCQGDDHWIAIACLDDDQFRRLAKSMGAPGLIANPTFATLSARLANREALDAIVAAWTVGYDSIRLAQLLQSEGVPAGQVANPEQLLNDAHLQSRGFFVELDRAVVGRHAYPGLPFRFSATPGAIVAPAPTLGQHNVEVLEGVLGVTSEEMRALEDQRVIGERPL
jgi:crotonobetainyl-CoA:carnitine CoA-transferase CaiB-like acyl-CoA transferase